MFKIGSLIPVRGFSLTDPPPFLLLVFAFRSPKTLKAYFFKTDISSEIHVSTLLLSALDLQDHYLILFLSLSICFLPTIPASFCNSFLFCAKFSLLFSKKATRASCCRVVTHAHFLNLFMRKMKNMMTDVKIKYQNKERYYRLILNECDFFS
jgi:hypothetical protein